MNYIKLMKGSKPKHPVINGKKVCSKCLIEKDVDQFWEEKRTVNGYHARCRLCLKGIKESYIHSNKDKVANAAKRRNDKYRCRRNKLRNDRLKNDPNFLLEKRHRGRIWTACKNYNAGKRSRSIDYLGCTYDFFRRHIESQFEDGMNWQDRNLWDIDHIIPLCSFDLTKENDMRKCFHYSNMRPLWKVENINKIKSDLKLKKYEKQ